MITDFLARSKNLTRIIRTSLGLSLLGATAYADPAFNAGDLLISFRATGVPGGGVADSVFTLSLGPAWRFRDELALGVLVNLNAGLTATFGSDWATRPDLYWGIVAVRSNSPTPGGVVNGDGNRTIYVSQDQTTLGVISTAPVVNTGTERGLIATDIATFGNAFDAAPLTAGTGGSKISTSENNDYSDFILESTQFNGNYGTGTNGIEGHSDVSITATALDLYRILNGNTAGTVAGAPIGTGSYEGTFTITSNGDLSFAVIPEPSALGLLGFGAFLYSGMARLRRRNRQEAI